MTTQSDANAPGRQIGGDHYKSEYMHWDLAADLNLGYFEGQISKYIVRHRQKEGLKDVQKCLHFLEKLRELVVEGRRFLPDRRIPDQTCILQFINARRQAAVPDLTPDEQVIFGTSIVWRGTDDLDRALEACERVLAGYP
jgi:hypothetical protein